MRYISFISLTITHWNRNMVLYYNNTFIILIILYFQDTIPHRELYICIAKQHTLSSYIRRNSELNMSSLHCIHRFKQRHPHSRLITNFIEFEIQRLSSIITQQFKSSNIQRNIRRNASNKKHHLKFVLSYDNTVCCEKISTKDMSYNSQSALFSNIRITI